MKKLIIFGCGDLAAIANEYFTNDSPYEVAAFTVDAEYIPSSMEFQDLSVIPFDRIEKLYPPETHDMYVALVYNNMNRWREEVCARAKAKGYKLASYISSKAFVSPSAVIGEHCFIFEDNTIQPFVAIGDNCILWSGNHVGHHSKIGANSFISSHVVISGHCDISDNCFIGVNSTISNGTTIGKGSWISHGSVISGDIPTGSFVLPPRSEVAPLNEKSLARALKREAEKVK